MSRIYQLVIFKGRDGRLRSALIAREELVRLKEPINSWIPLTATNVEDYGEVEIDGAHADMIGLLMMESLL